ncbi:uncharacterized protein LOC144137608 isoform X2 [Haemaphysalis longicornis]
MGPDLDSEAGAGSQRAVDATPPPPWTSSGPPNPCDDVSIVTPPPRIVPVVDLADSGGDTFIEVDYTKIMGPRRKKRKSPCSGEEVGAQKPGQFRAPKQERLEPEESRCQGGSPSVSHLMRPNDVLIKKEMLEKSRAVHNAEVDGTSVDAAQASQEQSSASLTRAQGSSPRGPEMGSPSTPFPNLQCAGPSQGTPRLPGTPSCPAHRDGAAESTGNGGSPLSEAGCSGLARTKRPADGVLGEGGEEEVIPLDDRKGQHGLVSRGEGHRPASTAPLGASVRGGGLLQAAPRPPSQPVVSGPREAGGQQPSSFGSGVSATTPSGESSADSSLPMSGSPNLAGKHGQRPWGTYYRGRGQRRVIPTAIRWRTSRGRGSTNCQQAQPSVSEDVENALAKHPCHREHASLCQPVGSVPNVHPLLSSRRVCPMKKHNFGIPCYSDGTQAAEGGDNVVLIPSEPATSGLEVSKQPWSKKRKRLVWYLRYPQSLPRLQACLSNWMAAMRRCELCTEELDNLNLCSIQTGHQTNQEVQSSAPSVDVDALVEAIETGVFPVYMYFCLWHAVCCPINGAPLAAATTSFSPRVEAVQLTEGESLGAGTAATGSASSPNGGAQWEAHVSSRPNSGTTNVSDEMAVTSTTASSASAAGLLLAASGGNNLVQDSRGEDLPAPPPSKRPVEEAITLKRLKRQEARRLKIQKRRRQRIAEGMATAGASSPARAEDPSGPLPSLEAPGPSGGPREASGGNNLVQDSRGEDLPAPPPSKRPVEEAIALKRLKRQEARRLKIRKRRRQRIAEGMATAGASSPARAENPSGPLPSLEAQGPSGGPPECAGPSQGPPRLPGTPSFPEHRDGAAEVAGSGGILLSEAGCGGLARTERPADGVHVEKGAEEVILLDDSEDQHGLVSGGEGHRPASTAPLGASYAGPSQEPPRPPGTPSCPAHRDGAAGSAGNGGSPLSEAGCGGLARTERPADGVHVEKGEEEVILLDDSEDEHGLVSGGEGHRPASTAVLEVSRAGPSEGPPSLPGTSSCPAHRDGAAESAGNGGSPLSDAGCGGLARTEMPADGVLGEEEAEEVIPWDDPEDQRGLVSGGEGHRPASTAPLGASRAGPSQETPRLPGTSSCPAHRDGAAGNAGNGGSPLSDARCGGLARMERPADGVHVEEGEEEVIPLDDPEDQRGLRAGPSQGTPRLPGTSSCPAHRDGAAESTGNGGSPLSEAGCGGLARTKMPADGVLVEEEAVEVILWDDPEDQRGLVSGGEGHRPASTAPLGASAPDSLATFQVGIMQVVASQLTQCGMRDPLAVPALPTSSENASAATGEDSRPSSTTDSGQTNTLQLQSPPPSWEIPNNNTAVVAVRIFPEFIYYCRTFSAFCSIRTSRTQVSSEPAVEYKGGGRTLISLEVYMVKAKPKDVFVASLKGELLRYDPDDTGGDHTGSYPIGGEIRCSALAGACIYVGLETGEIAAFDITSRKKNSYQCFKEGVACIKAERQQKLVCAVSDRGDVAVYTNSGALLWRLDGYQFVPTCIGINKRGIYVTTLDERLCKLENGIVQGFYACKGRAVGIHFYRNFIIHCSHDGKICAYCIKGEELHCNLVCYGAGKNNITCMDVSGNLVATGNADGNWEVVELKMSAALPCALRSCNLKFARPEDVLHHLKQEHQGVV